MELTTKTINKTITDLEEKFTKTIKSIEQTDRQL